MIKSKLEDFENHRKDLINYARNLLKTRGYTNKKDVLDETAKDIVQNCYIQFHKSFIKDSFINDGHIWSFLKTILYRCYQAEINSTQRNAQYNLFKTGEFDQLDVTKQPITKCNLNVEQFDYINKFRYLLKEKQLIVLDLILEGYNMVEISEKTNIPHSSIRGPRGIIEQIQKIYKVY